MKVIKVRLNSSPIPQYVPKENPIARVSGITKEKGEQLYTISFRHYNNNACEIKDLLKNRGRETLLVLKTIGISTPDTIQSNGIDRIRVNDDGEYGILFNGLPDEFDELFEHKIQGTSRIFYHTVENRFYIIAIINHHLETKKQRK